MARKITAFFLFISISSAAAYGGDPYLYGGGKEVDKADHLLAGGEMLISNFLLLGYNRYVTEKDYAMISPDSIRENLTHPWVWDQDEFTVNQIGHPYQGSFYFNAGRSNGLDFWDSAALTACGSVIWELFFETEAPSMNDFIATTMGGSAVGEMLHRLSLSAFDTKFSWISYILSPMDAATDFIKKREHAKLPENIEEADFSMFSGSVISKTKFADSWHSHSSGDLPVTLGFSLNLIYGKPFGNKISAPFEHFEFQMQGDISFDYYAVSLFSDGLLWSCAPFEDLNSRTTLGASMHYDVIFSKKINYSGNSIGFSCKQKLYCGNDLEMIWKLHLNWLVLGATEYYYFFSDKLGKPAGGEERRNYDLGTGENIKFFFTVSQPELGTFKTWIILNGIHTITDAVPDKGSRGYNLISIFGLSYEHHLMKNYYSGISNTMYYKKGFYDDAPDISQINDFLSLYFKIKIK